MLTFFFVLTLGFAFELGKNALKIDSRQVFNLPKPELSLADYLCDFPESPKDDKKKLVQNGCVNNLLILLFLCV